MAPEMATPSRVRTVIAADFDNDGAAELFYNNIPGSNRLFGRKEGGMWSRLNIGDAAEPDGYGTGAAVGDFDGDGSVNVNDLLSVIQQWNDPYTVDDLLVVIANWNNTCP